MEPKLLADINGREEGEERGRHTIKMEKHRVTWPIRGIIIIVIIPNAAMGDTESGESLEADSQTGWDLFTAQPP